MRGAGSVFFHFFHPFSFFLPSLPLILWNPNPSFVHTAQKLKKHGSNAPLGRSKHESTVGNLMHTTNWCRLLNLSRFLTVWSSFGSKLFSCETLSDSLILRRLKIVVGGRIFTVFFKRVLGFRHFERNGFEPHESTLILGSLCLWVRRDEFLWLLPELDLEIWA